MTKLLFMLTLITSLYMIAQSNNPMKMSFTMIISVVCSMALMYLTTSMSWMTMIYLMLFMGGILMMFMMLSSIMPNEKTMKTKMSKYPIFILIGTTIWLNNKMSMSNTLTSQMKSFLSSGMTMILMMSMILIYFLSSIHMASTEEYSMRSIICWKMN